MAKKISALEMIDDLAGWLQNISDSDNPELQKAFSEHKKTDLSKLKVKTATKGAAIKGKGKGANQREQEQKQEGSAKAKKQKQPKQKQKQKQPASKKKMTNPENPPFARLDIRVGRIVSAELHPNADSLFVEKIDLGEEHPRTIVSGLRKHYSLEEFVGHKCLVVVNLKPSPLRDIMSYGMVLAAKNEDQSVVELVQWPEGSHLGERITYKGYDVWDIEPDLEVNSKKKNSAWAKAIKSFCTNEDSVPCFDGQSLVTSAGACLTKSNIPNGTIS